MSLIKNNIKAIIAIIIILIIVGLMVFLIKREKSYTVEYDKDGYHIVEKYEKGSNIYSFKVSIDNHTYDYGIEHKYNLKRKVVNNIDSFDRDDYKCVSISAFNTTSNTICNKDNDYYDNIITKNNTSDVKKTIGSYTIYNDNNDYLIWNGYGFTNLLDDNKYNFLSNESYTNNLAFQFGDYIIVADYDSKHSFSKFYIYNNKKKSIDSWDTKASISFDAYFMGNIGEDLYLYDAANKLQYRMNIKKKKIKISSKNTKAVYYDKGLTETTVNKLYYNKMLFIYDKLYNYEIFNDHLYYKPYNSNINVRLSDLNSYDIVGEDNNNVYYMSSTKLYKFNPIYGEELLIDSFEWNFDYKNKIYVFSR